MVDTVSINYCIVRPSIDCIGQAALRLEPFFAETEKAAAFVAVSSRFNQVTVPDVSVSFGRGPRRGMGGETSYFCKLWLNEREGIVKTNEYRRSHYELWLEAIGLSGDLEVHENGIFAKPGAPGARHLPEPDFFVWKELQDTYSLRDFDSLDDVWQRTRAYLQKAAIRIDDVALYLRFSCREIYERNIGRLNGWGEWWELDFGGCPRLDIDPVRDWDKPASDVPEWVPLFDFSGRRMIEGHPRTWSALVSLVREGDAHLLEFSCLGIDIDRFHRKLKKATGIEFEILMPPEDRRPPVPMG